MNIENCNTNLHIDRYHPTLEDIGTISSTIEREEVLGGKVVEQ